VRLNAPESSRSRRAALEMLEQATQRLMANNLLQLGHFFARGRHGQNQLVLQTLVRPASVIELQIL
jgi:hypothetical protein